MSALLKQDYVLTPRGNDIYPGTWTRGHRLPKKVYQHHEFCKLFNKESLRM